MQVSGTPNKQELRREASYNALVESALRVFHDRGYAAATVSEIVAPTPYSPGAFYYHFDNKADCFWHVVEYREQLRGEWYVIPAAMTPANTSLTEIVAHALGRLATALKGYGAWTLVMVDFYQQHRDDPETRARLAVLYDSWVEQVGRFMRNLQAGGWIDPRRDPDLMATQVVAFQEGLSTHRNVFSFGDELLHRASVDGIARLLGPGVAGG
jgi:AcrR family transcriptional regulator